MSRRRKPVAPQGGDAWLATYGDMVTLLMAFFVMLFAISSVEQEKFEAFISGLDQFGNPGPNPIGSQGDLAAPIDAPVDVEVDPSMPSIDPAVGPSADPVSAGDPTALSPELDALGRQLLDAVAAAGHPGAIEITKDPRGLGVSIETDRVLFEVGSAQLTAQGLQIIAAVAPPLAGVGNSVLLEGHADNSPLNRNGYTNWNLSTDRAVAVVNSLVGHHGLAPHRLTASGFGEFRPRDPGTGPEARSRNRRVELIVLKDGLTP